MIKVIRSLNERAKRLGLATDMPSINRANRRSDLKEAVRVERKKKRLEAL